MTHLPPITYTRNHPFLASIKERTTLCSAGSKKNTQHVVLDLKGSGITYQVGDSIGIFPVNDPQLVEKTLQVLKASGNEIVLDRHAENSWKLREFFTSCANLTEVSRKLLSEICYRQSDPHKKAFIEGLFAEDNRDALKHYLEDRHLWDMLVDHSEVVFDPQELCNLLMPLLPRLYSIASSQKVVGEEVHLTVALLEYHSNGHYRRGVCTHYLCELAPIQRPIVPVYIQQNHGFTVPSDPDTSIIMIGPGTGIAPFRAFMHERVLQNGSGRNWLFFGEWNRKTEFFYEPYWNELIEQDKLRMDVAFSRDQDHKIYVQHRMLENGAELYKWIEAGACLYVCGDAQHMAKDVEAALLQIIGVHGNHDELAAKQYLKRLRAEKRYLRDVY